MAKRIKLCVLRVGNGLNQDSMAERIGVSRDTYARVELGKSDGTFDFWRSVQTAFGLSDGEMWEMIRDGKGETANNCSAE